MAIASPEHLRDNQLYFVTYDSGSLQEFSKAVFRRFRVDSESKELVLDWTDVETKKLFTLPWKQIRKIRK